MHAAVTVFMSASMLDKPCQPAAACSQLTLMAAASTGSCNLWQLQQSEAAPERMFKPRCMVFHALHAQGVTAKFYDSYEFNGEEFKVCDI